MTGDEFIKDRLDPQQKYFSSKSSKSKYWYFFFKVFGLLVAAIIPFLVGISKDIGDASRFIIGFLGVLSVILNGIELLYQHKQTWINFRMTSELLKQEKIYFSTQSGVYQSDNSLQLLVTRVEAIISAQNADWKIIAEQNSQKEEKKDDKKKDDNGGCDHI